MDKIVHGLWLIVYSYQLEPNNSNLKPHSCTKIKLNANVTLSSYDSQTLQKRLMMEFENAHLFLVVILGLLLFLYYLSPFELSVNEDDDDE